MPLLFACNKVRVSLGAAHIQNGKFNIGGGGGESIL